ncbi:MAG: tetratricopeptide repeat protein [bacterium]
MTHPTTDTGSPEAQPKAESFVDWFHINSRLVSIGAIIVVAIAFVFWFVQRQSLNETISSDKQLLTAKQSLNSGNAPLAEADLKKVVDRYADKPAGAEAGLLLGQLKLEKGDIQGAVTDLTALSAKTSGGPNAASVYGLLADATSQLGKPADAAASYEKAAVASSGLNQRGYWRAKEARALMEAGKPSDARKIYEDLASQHDNEALALEAKVRLGEFSAGAKP